MTYLIFDLAIAAVLVLFTLMGRKRGFILTLCGLLAVFVAFIGGAFLSDLMAPQVGRLIQPMVEEHVTQALQEAVNESQGSLEASAASVALDGLGQTVPQLPVEQALAALEGTDFYRVFGDALRNAWNEGLLNVTSSAAGAIAGYIAQEVARVILFLICFVVVLVAWNLLSHALDLAFRLPVLSSVNAMMGGVVGLIKGALLVFIAAWLLKGSVIPQAAQEQTYLLKFFCENSPLSLLAMI